MFKLIIVDDFRIERENVKDIILESSLELEVCGEYSNGRDALIAIEKELPDFILTDVEMPIMGGLEFAREVKRKYPQIKIIFFSLYDKFEYAKKAIEMEAYAYILKPIIEEEMISALKQIIEERKTELCKQYEDYELRKMLEISKPHLINSFKRNLFLGIYKHSDEVREQIEFLRLKDIGNIYVAISLEVDDYKNLMSNKTFEIREMFALRVTKHLEQVAEAIQDCLWVKMDECRWAFLFSSKKDSEDEIKKKAFMASVDLIRCLEENSISVSVGISSVFKNVLAISEMYEQATSVLDYKFRLGKGQIIMYDDILDNTGNYSIQFNEVQKELMTILNTRDGNKAEEFVERIFCKIEPYALESETKNLCFSVILYSQIILNSLNIGFESVFGKENLLWEKLMKYETIMDVKLWLKDVLLSIIQYINSKNNNQFSRIIEEAKKYIKKNYSQKITVKSIADELLYSSNYLNNIFKQETGETILEYITNVRVEEAKTLVKKDPNIKMYELAEAVGYSHDSYFKNIFKQYTGLTPKEYRDSL